MEKQDESSSNLNWSNFLGQHATSSKNPYLGAGDASLFRSLGNDEEFAEMSPSSAIKMFERDGENFVKLNATATENSFQNVTSASKVVDDSVSNETINGYFYKKSNYPDGGSLSAPSFLKDKKPVKESEGSRRSTKSRESITNFILSSKSNDLKKEEILSYVMDYCFEKQELKNQENLVNVPEMDETYSGGGICEVSKISSIGTMGDFSKLSLHEMRQSGITADFLISQFLPAFSKTSQESQNQTQTQETSTAHNEKIGKAPRHSKQNPKKSMTKNQPSFSELVDRESEKLRKLSQSSHCDAPKNHDSQNFHESCELIKKPASLPLKNSQNLNQNLKNVHNLDESLKYYSSSNYQGSSSYKDDKKQMPLPNSASTPIKSPNFSTSNSNEKIEVRGQGHSNKGSSSSTKSSNSGNSSIYSSATTTHSISTQCAIESTTAPIGQNSNLNQAYYSQSQPPNLHPQNFAQSQASNFNNQSQASNLHQLQNFAHYNPAHFSQLNHGNLNSYQPIIVQIQCPFHQPINYAPAVSTTLLPVYGNYNGNFTPTPSTNLQNMPNYSNLNNYPNGQGPAAGCPCHCGGGRESSAPSPVPSSINNWH